MTRLVRTGPFGPDQRSGRGELGVLSLGSFPQHNHSAPKKPMTVFLRFTLRLAVGAFLALLPRAEAATFAEEVARLATPLVDASGLTPTRSVGLVVMVVTDQGTRTFGFGARSVHPDLDRAGEGDRAAGRGVTVEVQEA